MFETYLFLIRASPVQSILNITIRLGLYLALSNLRYLSILASLVCFDLPVYLWSGMMALKKEFGVFLLALVFIAPNTAMAWFGDGESELNSIPQYFCQFISAETSEDGTEKKKVEEEEEEEPDCD